MSPVAVRRTTNADGSVAVGLLADDLAKIPVELRKPIRAALRAAAEKVRGDAQSNASWSTRIPASLSVKVSFSQTNPGVYIEANAKRAPHARVFEGMVADTFRHPVFGHRDRPWVDQAARPFLWPAARANYGPIVEALAEAVDTTLAAHGFGR